MFYGARVVRGPDWEWKNQDDGPGHVGTVIVPEPEHINDIATVWVHWDNGVSANYNGGKGKGCDLRIYDNGQLGVKQNGIRCDGCMKQDLDGFRWKCAICSDFDLCTNCYMSDNHDTGHPFQRIDVPRANPVKLGIREGAQKLKAKGIFPGATVKRGLKWEWGDQDGGKGKTGMVSHLDNWDQNTYRSKVRVEWSNGKSNVYRLGFKGNIDLIYEKGKEGQAGYFYPDHLPVLDFERTPNFITPGDQVRVKQLSKDVFKKAQSERCGWKDEMTAVLGQVGEVTTVDKDGDIKVVFANIATLFINPACLLPEKKGDQGRASDGTLDAPRVTDTDTGLSLLLQSLLQSSLSTRTANADVLRAAAVKGDIRRVKEILQRSPSWIDQGNSENGYNSLHLASHQGHFEVVEALISAKADLEAPDNVGDRALAFSAFGNKPSVTRLLLRKGSKVNATNRGGRSSLNIAASKGNSACVSVLLNHPEIQVNLQDIAGLTPMMRAIESDDQATVDLLADEPNVDFDLRNKKGFNSLQYAALQGSTYAAERIVSKCGSGLIEDKKSDGWTALHVAANNNHTGVAKALVIRGGADKNCRNNSLETPLHLSCSKGLNDSIEFLVNGGAKVNLQDEDGDTPLHTMLMKQSVRDIIGSTPTGMLMQTLESGDTSTRNTAAIAIYLIKNGADIYLRNHKGRTVLDCVGNPTLQNMLKNAHTQVRLKPLLTSITAGRDEECIIS